MTRHQLGTAWRRLASAAGADDGVALATVVGVSAVLFILATMLVTVATQQQVSASNQLQRTKALHAADAGISAYCYMLSRNGYIAQSQPTTTGATTDASWTVTAVPPSPGSAVTKLTAVGSIKADLGAPAITRTVKATVRPAAFSDYMFLTNQYFHLGSGGMVRGNVRSNSYITNDGEITGYAYAVSYCNGSGVYDHTPIPNYAAQSFAVVDFGSLKSIATNDGSYWGDSGTFVTSGSNRAHYLGYKVVLSGTGGTVTKIRSISTTTGVMSTDTTSTSFTTPADGVLYFDDPVWLSGTYGAMCTVVVGDDVEALDNDNPYGGASVYGRNSPGPGSSYPGKNSSGANVTISIPGTNTASVSGPWPNAANSSVTLWNNLQPTDPNNPTLVCGIVTPGDISMISEYPDTVTPTNLYIQAAMLTTNGSLHADWGPKPAPGTGNMLKNYLQILGAEAMWDQGFTQSGTSTGFKSRDYLYDTNLDVNTPPNFPALGDGTLRVKSWVEQ